MQRKIEETQTKEPKRRGEIEHWGVKKKSINIYRDQRLRKGYVMCEILVMCE